MKNFKKFLLSLGVPVFGMLFWLYPSTSFALVSGSVFVDDIVYLDCSGSNQVYGYASNSEDFSMSVGCDDWNGDPQYHYSDFGVDTWRLIEAQNINNFDCSNDEILLRPLTYNECLNSIYYVGNSTLIVSDIPIAVSFITTGSFASMLESTGTLLGDIWQIIALCFGIPLGFYILREIIGFASIAGRRRQ
jgi:hypothetical protein